MPFLSLFLEGMIAHSFLVSTDLLNYSSRSMMKKSKTQGIKLFRLNQLLNREVSRSS